MSGADHWMRFNVGDYLADMMHLSTIQHGMYCLMIFHYFKRGTLPSDDKALARIAKLPVAQMKRHSDAVMSLFRLESDGWHHRRIDAERARAYSAREGQNGAGTRARPEPEPDSPPVAPQRGARGRGNGKPARNGFCDVAADLILEHPDVETVGPRPGSSRVADFPRRAGRGVDDARGGDDEARCVRANAA